MPRADLREYSRAGAARDRPRPHRLLPFNHTAIVAPTGGGKTSWILNFFIRNDLLDMYFNFYDKIYFISPHVNAAGSGYELLRQRNNHGRFAVKVTHSSPLLSSNRKRQHNTTTPAECMTHTTPTPLSYHSLTTC